MAFVADLDAPALDADDHHHLARVRRVRDGDPLVIADGAGRWRRATMAGAAPRPVGEVEAEAAPAEELAVAFALVKGSKPELAVQKLTELGIDRMIPFVAARSVVRWDLARAEAAHARLVRVAREAAAQSRRSRLPVVEAVTDFAELAARPGATLADRGAPPPGAGCHLLLVGPEGGWDAGEQAAGLPRAGLAGGVLRAETAAIVAGALLVALRDGLVAAADPPAEA